MLCRSADAARRPAAQGKDFVRTLYGTAEGWCAKRPEFFSGYANTVQKPRIEQISNAIWTEARAQCFHKFLCNLLEARRVRVEFVSPVIWTKCALRIH